MNLRDKKLTAAGIALVVAVAFHLAVFVIAGLLPDGSYALRVAEVIGATFPGGLIQLATTALFVYAMVLSFGESRRISAEHAASELQLLPEREQLVLDAEDIARIKLEAIEMERRQPSFLTDLVKKACTQFRANSSVQEVMDVVQSQSRINRQLSNAEVDDLYQVNAVIPSVGFIGTIIGIASALGLAYLVVPEAPSGDSAAQAQAGIAAVTQALYVAFDTTLYALLLNLVLSFRLSSIRARLERLHGYLEGYVLENLVNRIYHG